MKTLKIGCVVALAVLAGASPSAAQNTTFTYQGRVQDNGTNYTGLGQFKFALLVVTNTSSLPIVTINYFGTTPQLSVSSITMDYGGSGYLTAPTVTFSGGSPSDATGYATISGGSVTAITITSGGNYPFYGTAATITISPPPAALSNLVVWSDDGTTGLGAYPVTSVPLGVTNGLFTVALGGAEMTALPASVFSQASLQLQIGFNDGVNGYNAFPPQTLTPAPYVIVPGSVSSSVTPAIQGLNERLNEKDAEIQHLESGMAALQAAVKQLAAQK